MEPIWLKFVLLSELWPGMATKKFQPDQLNSSGDIALDHNGTCGLERRYIWTRTPKDFPPLWKLKDFRYTQARNLSKNQETSNFANPILPEKRTKINSSSRKTIAKKSKRLKEIFEK